MSPKGVVKAWVEAFNRADADAISSFYSESAINHQVAEDKIRGRDEIRKKFASEFANADRVCIVENLFEDGEWAILEWRDPLGVEGLRFLSRRRWQDRVPKRLLGQALLPTAARVAHSPVTRT